MTDKESLQKQYDSLIEEASALASEIQRLSTEIGEINRVVPQLAEKLQAIRGRCHECAADYDPDHPEAPDHWQFLQDEEEPINFAPSLKEIEKEANRQIRALQKELMTSESRMYDVKERFREIVITDRRDKILITRNRQSEVRYGLAAPETGGTAPEAGASNPDIPRKKKPGRQKDPGIEDRNVIVHKHIKTSSDFKNMQKVEALFQELDAKPVPLPQRHGPPRGWNPKDWQELLTKPRSEQFNRTIKTLRRGMFPRKKRPLGTK